MKNYYGRKRSNFCVFGNHDYKTNFLIIILINLSAVEH